MTQAAALNYPALPHCVQLNTQLLATMYTKHIQSLMSNTRLSLSFDSRHLLAGWLGSLTLAKRWWQLAFLLRSRSDPFSRTIGSSGQKTLRTSHNSLRFYLESLRVCCRCLSWRTSLVSDSSTFYG